MPAHASNPALQLTPPVIVKYGVTGGGKSIDDLFSWAGSAVFFAMPGALRGSYTVCGFDVSSRIIHVSTVEEVIAWLPRIRELGYTACVVDDLSLLMKNTHLRASAAFKAAGDGWGLYEYLREVIYNLGNQLRWLGIAGVVNSHEQPAFSDAKSGESYLAGPDMSWKKLVKHMPHICDLLLRVRKPDPNRADWDTICDCHEGFPGFYQKDRFDKAIPVGGPLNTAEILRAAGFVIPRPQGLEWMEEVAENMATWMVGGTPEEQARAHYRDHLRTQNVTFEHVRWALRDGTHRGRLRIHNESTRWSSL